MSNKCPQGQILRVGYSYEKKKTVNVKPTCIIDKGKPGKGLKLFEIPKEDIGLLSDYGYSLKKNYDERIKAIKKATRDYSKLKILKHINALRTLQKSNEKYYRKLDKDLRWLQDNY
jgi:succinate dehydrogenase/fumarate reductase flavoprotein subunit